MAKLEQDLIGAGEKRQKKIISLKSLKLEKLELNTHLKKHRPHLLITRKSYSNRLIFVK